MWQVQIRRGLHWFLVDEYQHYVDAHAARDELANQYGAGRVRIEWTEVANPSWLLL